MLRRVIVIIWSVMLVVSGMGAASAADKTTEQLLEEAKAAVKNVPISDVKRMIEAKEGIVVLDVRDMRGFVLEHLPGAQNMSRAVNLSPRILEHHMQKTVPDKNAKIIVYCDFDTRSPLAVKAMNEIGYANAVYMKGGLKAWKEAGYPLEK
jgi:rhodanese-related sulfurtransferase